MIIVNTNYLSRMIVRVKSKIDALPLPFDIPDQADIVISWSIKAVAYEVTAGGVVRGRWWGISAYIGEVRDDDETLKKLYKASLKMITRVAMV